MHLQSSTHCPHQPCLQRAAVAILFTFWQVCCNCSTHLHLLQLCSEPDHLGFQFRNFFSAISPSNYCYQRVTSWHHCTAHFQTITKTCQTAQNLSVGRTMQIFTLYINIYKYILNLGVSTNLKFGHISS